MPQVTVYVRDEDLSKWRGIEKKAQFIHEALNSKVLSELVLNDILESPEKNTGMVKNPNFHVTIEEDPNVPHGVIISKPKVIKTPSEAKKVAEDIAPHKNFLDKTKSRL